jgi:hypothetical protein
MITYKQHSSIIWFSVYAEGNIIAQERAAAGELVKVDSKPMSVCA